MQSREKEEEKGEDEDEEKEETLVSHFLKHINNTNRVLCKIKRKLKKCT